MTQDCALKNLRPLKDPFVAGTRGIAASLSGGAARSAAGRSRCLDTTTNHARLEGARRGPDANLANFGEALSEEDLRHPGELFRDGRDQQLVRRRTCSRRP